MKASDLSPADTIVCLSPQELSLVRNVVTFVLEEIEDFEFQTRLGVYKEEVRAFICLLDSNEFELDDGRGFVFSENNMLAVHSSFNEILNGLYVDDYRQNIGADRDYLMMLGEKFGITNGGYIANLQ